MSLAAITWALKEPIKPAVRKLVLIKLADNACERTGQCFPSVKTIAGVCGCDERTVQRHIKALIGEGYITVIAQGGIINETRRANVYSLTRGWAGESINRVGDPRHDDRGQPATGDTLPPVPPARCHPTPGTLPPQPVIEPVSKPVVKGKQPSKPPKELVEAYEKHLPFGRQIAKWSPDRKKLLAALVKENPEAEEPGFWSDYFAEAALDKFIRGEVPGRDGREPFRVTIDYLLRPKVYADFYERAVDREGKAA